MPVFIQLTSAYIFACILIDFRFIRTLRALGIFGMDPRMQPIIPLKCILDNRKGLIFFFNGSYIYSPEIQDQSSQIWFQRLCIPIAISQKKLLITNIDQCVSIVEDRPNYQLTIDLIVYTCIGGYHSDPHKLLL